VSLLPPPPVPDPPTIPPPPEPGPASAAGDIEAPSRGPLVVGVAVIVAVLGTGALLWSWAARPARCDDANVSSERFGYCITAPPGWRLAEPADEAPPADQLFRPDGDSTLFIQAIETGRGLTSFAEDVRRLQADNGLDTEEMQRLTVAGADALRWDATLGSSGNVRARTVVFERGGVVWRLQFADSAEAFDEHVGELGQMLRSWQFR
jgi:hypothetical protein